MRLDDWQAMKFSQNGLRFLILILVIPLFFFPLIVSVSLTNTLPSALLHLFLAPHLGDSFPVKTKYSKIHLNKITQSKVLNFLFLERKTTNPKTYFEVNEFLFFFLKLYLKKEIAAMTFP